MRLKALFLSAMLAVSMLAGCAGPDLQRYASEQPALDLRTYFDGRLEGHGMVTDRSGMVTRRFVVTIQGTWRDGVGTLDEDFVWSDGERERRVWTLRQAPGAPGGWTGTAADVVGEAAGRTSGNALQWAYTYRLKTKEGKTYDLQFDDWMFLIDRQVLLNRATMRFWGVRVGEVIISFRKI
jgi:hypothetical protein